MGLISQPEAALAKTSRPGRSRTEPRGAAGLDRGVLELGT